MDPELPHLPAIERAAEVLRYQTLRLEYALSPDGLLRAWLRLIMRLAAFALFPTVLLVPGVTFILGEFRDWTAFLLAAVENLVATVFSLGLLLLAAVVLCSIFRHARRR